MKGTMFEYLYLLYAAAEREKDNTILNLRKFRFADLRMRSQIMNQSRAASNLTQYGLYCSEILLPAGPSESHDFMTSQRSGNVWSREGWVFHNDHDVRKAICSAVASGKSLDRYLTSSRDADFSEMCKSDG